MTRSNRHKSGKAGFALTAIAATYLMAAPAAAGDIFVMAGGANARLNVESMQERKFSTIVKQRFDFSCGSAALATLLTHHYGLATGEAEPLKAMWEVGDKDRIRELGFSLFEMKSYLEARGLLADGFKLSLDRIEEIGVPGIALIDDKGYKHFVVVKGLSKKRVLVGDPSTGLKTIKRKKFEEIWDGTILFIRSDVQTGKENFNKIADWKLSPSPPFDRALDDESLQNFTLSHSRPSFSGFTIGISGEPQ